jgi:hypothetical protein
VAHDKVAVYASEHVHAERREAREGFGVRRLSLDDRYYEVYRYRT